MRTVIVDPRGRGPKLERTPENDQRLRTYLATELANAKAGRQQVEAEWLEAYRMLEAQPKRAVVMSPIPHAPNIEIPLGAMFSETVYATVVDTLFQMSPLLTVRGDDPDETSAMQFFVDKIVQHDLGLRDAVDEAFLDCTNLGTGVFYIPYVDDVKHGAGVAIKRSGPRIYAVPPEDLLVPPASDSDIQALPWVAIRKWYTPGEFAGLARRNEWDVGNVQPSAQVDQVRSARQRLARQADVKHTEHHQVWLVWAFFDYDNDGVEEDLYIVWHTDEHLLKVSYNPWDWRPLTVCRYLLRPHMFWGKGVVEITRPFEEQVTDLHNARMLNIHLANGRVWFGPTGALGESFTVYPNRVKEVPDPSQIVEKKLADEYPSAWHGEANLIALAERRLGLTGDVSSGSPASRVLGTRTPGITAITALQAISRRFTPAFDSMRLAATEAIVQALWRYHERIAAGDRRVLERIARMIGPDRAVHVENVLRDPHFIHDFSVEFTASSATVNREAERQNAMLLVNILGQYYQRVLELTQLAATPGVPQPVVRVAVQVAEKASQIIDRTIRTFDQVRDPQTFIVDVEQDMAQAGVEAQAMSALAQMMQGAQAAQAGPEASAGMSAVPPAAVPPELAALAEEGVPVAAPLPDEPPQG